MKITCQACAAKYTIADDKVLGKIVKIRCKKCGATIVVNGNDPSASAGSGAPEPPRAFDYASQGTQGDAWTVNVADGDQRTMSDAEIVAAYHEGVVSDESFCWKDGMTDWLPVREIEQLYAACTATRAQAAPSHAMAHDEGVTKIQDTGASLFGGGPQPSAYVPPRPAAGAAQDNNGAMHAQAMAARRSGGRAPAADLFGGAAQAGSEEDVMTSAPSGMPQAHDDGKLTGQRNENSVLFSLNALTSNAPPKGAMTASSEASGLIDIRQLSSQLGMGEDKKKSRIDDIMNLAGGGAFSPALNGPVMSAPPIEEYAPQPEAAAMGSMLPAQNRSRMLIFGAIGAGVLVIVGAIGVAVMMTHKGSEKADGDKTASSASAAAAMTAAPSDSVAMNPAPEPTDTTAATTAAPPATTTTPAATTAAATPPRDTPSPRAAATPKDTSPPSAPPAVTRDTPAAPPAAAAAAAGTDQPFNMGEAKARLASIAGSVQGCKKGDFSGSGRAVVTFAPSGAVQSVSVSGVDNPGVSACVSGRFRGARVPAFSGSPFSVSKSFSIN